MVVLKPLTRAVAEGDRIYGVIRGSAVNNDGVTEGLTVPSVVAQQEVVRLACERAGVDPRCVQYVELHGTGTRLGDPIEARALGAALGGVRGDKAPVVVGLAKTNVGHLEGAAGIVGLLKLVLSVWHGEIPASLNFQTPNPGIPLEALNLRVAQTLGPGRVGTGRWWAGCLLLGWVARIVMWWCRRDHGQHNGQIGRCPRWCHGCCQPRARRRYEPRPSGCAKHVSLMANSIRPILVFRWLLPARTLTVARR